MSSSRPAVRRFIPDDCRFAPYRRLLCVRTQHALPSRKRPDGAFYSANLNIFSETAILLRLFNAPTANLPSERHIAARICHDVRTGFPARSTAADRKQYITPCHNNITEFNTSEF